MHKPESAQDNQTQKIAWDFEIHRPPNPGELQSKIKESEKRNKYLDLAREPVNNGDHNYY